MTGDDNNRVESPGPRDGAAPEGGAPFWGKAGSRVKWPKINGEKEEAVFLTHSTSVDMADVLLINMLEAFGIPTLKTYPLNGAFGKLILGISGGGADIYVPKSMHEDALALLESDADEEIF